MIKKFSALLLLSSSLLAQEIYDDPSFELQNTPPPFYPISFSGQYLNISPAGFRTPEVKESNLVYGQATTEFAYTQPFSEYCGLIFGAGWVGTEVDMKDNPEFDETFFNYVNLSVGGFTKAFPDWTWTLSVAAYFDTESFSLMDYTLYQGVLWGQYQLCPDLEFDFGIITEIGLRKEKVWPILGFTYFPCETLRIYAIYPINIALEWDFACSWTVAGSIRFLRNRHRLGDDEPNPQGIFEYESAGGEFDLVFSPVKWITAKGFVGSTFGGDLRVSNQKDKNTTHYKFKPSYYAGVSGVVSF